MTDPKMPIIRLDHLKKTFGTQLALDNVCLDIPRGQMWGLLGPNGAGKTTLFRILMGILKATSGSALIAGRDVFEERIEVKRSLGFLPDEPVFHSYLTGREIIELCAAMHGLDPMAVMTRLSPLIDRMKLRDALDSFADDFSRGMKKKLGLLLALLHEPELLILDEPTNGLDVESTALFFDLMREQRAAGRTVVFSTHLLPQVEALCTHVAIIHLGRLVAQGDLKDIAVSVPDAESLEQAFLAMTRSAPTKQSPWGVINDIPR
jgi:ABC-type multidrug transport system ATPase subunit